ncbi:hypothetical protein G6F60_014491 [Rhizopus arrhizus]|nr:hypothetical protein G6F60_014491 [Rhizopus arrhizus]
MATSTDSTIEDTMVIENWRTMAMPISAPVIWPMDFRVACLGVSPSSAITRSTFSTTTMASSTRMPMASTMPNIVIMFTEKPSTDITANVPSRHTGTTIVGIRV